MVLKEIKKDLKAVQTGKFMAILANRGFHALLVYRISRFLWERKVPVISLILTRIVQILYGVDIDYRAKIGGGCMIIHGYGLVIGCGSVIGENARLYHGVTLGIVDEETDGGYPTIGHNVIVGCGAKILGTIRIGNGVKIGANAVVMKDIPDFCTAVGIPARVVTKSAGEKLRVVEGKI